MAIPNDLKLPEVKITIDQDALRAQIDEAIATALREASLKLRMAADDLDPSFWPRQEAYMNDERNKSYDLGYIDGKEGKSRPT